MYGAFMPITGRPSKLTPELQKSLLTAIMVGLSVEKACRYVKIDRHTYYNWINQGKTDDQEEKDSPYKDFFHALINAEEKAELNLLKNLQSETDWRAKAFLLERRFKKDWSRTEQVQVTGKDGQPIINVNYDFEKIPRDKLREIINVLKSVRETQEIEKENGKKDD